MPLIVRIDFSEISFRCWNEHNDVRRFYIAMVDYYTEFYSHADAQWKCTSRKKSDNEINFNRHKRFVFNKTDSIGDCSLTIVRIRSLLLCARTVDGWHSRYFISSPLIFPSGYYGDGAEVVGEIWEGREKSRARARAILYVRTRGSPDVRAKFVPRARCRDR